MSITARRPWRSLRLPQTGDISIHSTPLTVTDMPACHGANPNWRDSEPTMETKAIIAMVPHM